MRLGHFKGTHGSGTLHASPPAPLVRQTRLVSAPVVVHDTTQPIQRSRGVSLRMTTHCYTTDLPHTAHATLSMKSEVNKYRSAATGGLSTP